MTIQESFERCFHVIFLAPSPTLLIVFQNETIEKEFDEDLEKISGYDYFLHIAAKGNFIQLNIANANGDYILTSGDIQCSNLDSFIAEVDENALINIYSTTATIHESVYFPRRDWYKKQYNPNKIVLMGYSVTNIQ